MSQMTTHQTDTISKNQNGDKRKTLYSDVEHIEAAECDTPISERKKLKKKSKLKLGERQESQTEQDSCSLNDTPNKRQKGAEERNEVDLNVDNGCKQPQAGTYPKDSVVPDAPVPQRKEKKRKEKKKKTETNQELNDENTEPAEGDKPQSQISDDGSLILDTAVSKKRKEKKKVVETGNALNSENLQQSECEKSSLTVDTPRSKKRKKEKNIEDENKNDQDVIIDEERSVDLSSCQIDVEGCAQKPNLMLDTPRKKKKKKDKGKLNDETTEAVDGASVSLMLDMPTSKKKDKKLKEKQENTETGNVLNSENLQQSECEEPILTLDTPRIKKRRKEKNIEDANKNTENKKDQDVIIDEERSVDLSSCQIDVEGCAPKPNLMLDTPRKKKRKKDKGKLNDETTEPVEGDKPQAQVSVGGSTLMLDMPTSKKKDKKRKEKQKNTETGNALNSENLQHLECEEPILTFDTSLIKKRKKDKRSKDSQKNDEKKDSQDVHVVQSTDLTDANVSVTFDTPSKKKKDKVKKKKSESNQNLNDDNLEHLSSQTKDVSPPPDTIAVLNTPTRKKKKKERGEKCGKNNQELNDDLQSAEREVPAGETTGVALLKKRKGDKKSKKIKKSKKDKTLKKKSISWSDFFSLSSGPRKRWMVCEGFQFILNYQAEALLKLGVNPCFKDVLCQLWRIYLQTSRQAYTNNPIRHSHLKRAMLSQSNDVSMDSSFVSSEDDRHTDMFSDTGETSGEEAEESECESVISGSFDAAKYLTQSRKRAGSLLSMRKTLGLCYLALVWCREGITLSELLRFVSEGHIPYVNAHELFPEDMKPTGRDTLIFRVTSIPLYKDVNKEAQNLAIYMDLPRFPPIGSQCLLHPAVLSLRYLTHVNLPDQLYEWVCWVIEKAGLSDESINTPDPMNSPLPRYDLQTAAIIIVTMKLLFGCDDQTEWDLSSKAGILDKKHPEKKRFHLRRWYRLLQSALTRATHARNQFTARKQWTHKKALLRGKSDAVVLKHRRVVEQLQASFEMVSGRSTGPQPSSPSTFIFRWGPEGEQGRSDGPSLHEQSLSYVSVRTRTGLKLCNRNYWHADLKDCKTRLACKSHYKELESSVLPRSYVWLLKLFSFLLDVRTATLHEEVKSVERKLFKQRIQKKRSLKSRRWRHWWRTRGHLINM